MDDERLKNPPGKGQKDYFDELLERIRDIPSSERRFYQKVLDIYGLQTTRPGGIVRKDDVAVAKNYLKEEELQVLNRMVNLYIEYAELQALERNAMTMQGWITKLDEFLKISDRKLLDYAGKISAEYARAKAEVEYAQYRKLLDAQPQRVDVEFEKAAKELKKLSKLKKPKPNK